MKRELNFIAKRVKNEAFGEFGMFNDGDTVEVFDHETEDFASLLTRFGVFPSYSQARKHGYMHAVPQGWTEMNINRCRLFIWNPTDLYFVDQGDAE